MSEKVTVYELAYVLKVGESDAALKAVLAKNGATVIKEQPLSQIQLAYPIEKQGIALFGYQHLTLPSGAAVSAISDALLLESSVLRSIIVKLPSTRKAKASVERREKRANMENVAPSSEKTKKTASATPGVDRLDGLSNEKLSKTLEDILK